MLNILICEDEKYFLDELTRIIEEGMSEKVHITPCNTKAQLIKAAEEEFEEYDVVLMDIRLNNDDGITLAAGMKKKNPRLRVIFISGYIDEYLEGLFLQVNPFGVLKKPLNRKICIQMLEKAAEEKKDSGIRFHDTFSLRVIGGEIRKIPLNQIELFESSRRILIVNYSGGTERCYEKLDHLERQLPDQFLRCHKSFLVNMDKIRNFEKHRIELESGRVVDVSRSRLKEAREKYFRYVGAKL